MCKTHAKYVQKQKKKIIKSYNKKYYAAIKMAHMYIILMAFQKGIRIPQNKFSTSEVKIEKEKDF